MSFVEGLKIRINVWGTYVLSVWFTLLIGYGSATYEYFLVPLLMKMKSDFGLLILLSTLVTLTANIEEGILSYPPEVPSLDIQTGSWPGQLLPCPVSWEDVSPVIIMGFRCGSCFTLGHTRKQTNRSLILS